MFLPVLTLSFPNICILAQIQRDSFIDVLKRPFILTARSKGLSKFRIFMKHALKPSLVPSIGFLGPTIASILSGTVFVESFFGFPGLGTLTIQAALYRNYNMILALVIIYSVMLILCNLVVDILYGYLDPRMRVS
jgi:oligopeptide transport system permease protein